MKWIASSHFPKPMHYEIEHDLVAGFYLYVFENGKCIRDYLQDTLEVAMECARDDFGVTKDAWVKVE